MISKYTVVVFQAIPTLSQYILPSTMFCNSDAMLFKNVSIVSEKNLSDIHKHSFKQEKLDSTLLLGLFDIYQAMPTLSAHIM